MAATPSAPSRMSHSHTDDLPDDDNKAPVVYNTNFKFPDLIAADVAKGAFLKTRPFVEPPPECEMVESVEDLLKKAKQARKEKWIQQYSLARIRRKLGLPVKKENMTADQMDKLKMMFINFIKSVMDLKEKSPFLKILFSSTKDQPDEAILIMQFLYYADANTSDQDFVRIADLIAKEPNLGGWCRDVLKDPNDHHDVIIECALCHLEKFMFIVSNKEKKQFITNVLFCGATDYKQGFAELQKHLLSVAKHGKTTRGITLAHSIYLHNLIELTLFGKHGSSRPTKLIEAWKKGLEERMAEFPPQQYWQTVIQLEPYCASIVCFKRAPFACCENASYCSSDCRENHWERHQQTGCGNGKTKKDLDYTPVGQRPDDPVPQA